MPVSETFISADGLLLPEHFNWCRCMSTIFSCDLKLKTF
jgi:hypothetical protein